MNEFFLDAISGNNLTPRRLDKKISTEKTSEIRPTERMSFQEVLKDVADEVEASPEIRQELVNQYKVSLANGTYEVKAQELAEKIIQKIRENKTREII